MKSIDTWSKVTAAAAMAATATAAALMSCFALTAAALMSCFALTAAAAPAAPTTAVAPPTTVAEARQQASKDSAQLTAFKRAIREKYDLKESAFARHDAEAIVTRFYTSDVISVGEGEGIFIGRDQIRPLYQEVVKDNTVKVDSVHTFVNGNAGWDWADFHVYPADPKIKSFTFAILFLWTKVGGEWMCKGDFFVKGGFREGKLHPSEAP